MTASPAPFPAALAEPHAFALLAWPAAAALATGAAWPLWAQILLGAWLALVQLAAYSGGRGAGHGHVLLLSSAIVALAAHFHPSPWTLAAFPALLVCLQAAQRARWKTREDAVTGNQATDQA